MRPLFASGMLAGAVGLATVVVGYGPAMSKSPFTVTNDPVGSTVADTMMQRFCKGTLVPIWWSFLPNMPVQSVFYRRPDGTKWVKFGLSSRSLNDLPVTELGVSAQWTDYPVKTAQHTWVTHYAVWPRGENGLSGTTTDPWGTVDLTCD